MFDEDPLKALKAGPVDHSIRMIKGFVGFVKNFFGEVSGKNQKSLITSIRDRLQGLEILKAKGSCNVNTRKIHGRIASYINPIQRYLKFHNNPLPLRRGRVRVGVDKIETI
ncbi:MAG: hypothetical protein A2V86_01385 [Deltaproteobacteria bacterium RBG_16_49_23]|nr:MAG: hypothetical protein A2V86_01385 [Deltaproteobacteria bacterium RBG_16_49_23]